MGRLMEVFRKSIMMEGGVGANYLFLLLMI